MCSNTYKPDDHVWVFLSENFGWWPATVGKEPKLITPASTDEELGPRRLEAKRKQHDRELPPPPPTVSESSLSARFRNSPIPSLPPPARHDGSEPKVSAMAAAYKKDLKAIAKKEMESKKEEEMMAAACKKDLKAKKQEVEQKEGDEVIYRIRFMDDDDLEFRLVSDPQKLKPYDCPERLSLVQEGFKLLDPVNFGKTKKAQQEAESRLSNFIKDVETYEAISGLGFTDTKVADFLAMHVHLDATPAEMEALEKEQAAAKKAKQRKRRAPSTGSRRGRGGASTTSRSISGDSSSGSKENNADNGRKKGPLERGEESPAKKPVGGTRKSGRNRK